MSQKDQKKSFRLYLEGGTPVDLSLLYEEDSGLYFAIDSSYLEQAVGPVISPYENGTLRFEDDEFDLSESCGIVSEVAL